MERSSEQQTYNHINTTSTLHQHLNRLSQATLFLTQTKLLVHSSLLMLQNRLNNNIILDMHTHPKIIDLTLNLNSLCRGWPFRQHFRTMNISVILFVRTNKLINQFVTHGIIYSLFLLHS